MSELSMLSDRALPAPRRALPLLGALLFMMGSPVRAHLGLDETIADVTERMAKDPANADLYRVRGDLYREAGDERHALDDYAWARHLDPSLPALDLRVGRLLLESGAFADAVAALDDELACDPRSIESYVERARAEIALGRPGEAVDDFDRALDLCLPPIEPRPEHFLERARAAVAAGDTARALAGLEEGLGRLGPVITLDLAALDLEIGRGDGEAALQRVDAIAARSARKEQWLFQRGEILLSLGRTADAKSAFGRALDALTKVPPARREAPATRELEARVQSSLASLRSASGPRP